MRRKVGQARCAGFTLIELLIALAVLGLMATLAFDGLRFALKAWGRSMDSSAAIHDVSVAQRFIRTRVEALRPFYPVAGFTSTAAAVVGDEKSLSFSSFLTSGVGASGHYRFTLDTTSTSRGSDLRVSWRLERHDNLGSIAHNSVSEEALIEGIANVSFEYLAADTAGNKVWLQHWRHRTDIPQLVRVRLTFPAGDPRSWPELIVAPRITADANCAFDVVSQQCRT